MFSRGPTGSGFAQHRRARPQPRQARDEIRQGKFGLLPAEPGERICPAHSNCCCRSACVEFVARRRHRRAARARNSVASNARVRRLRDAPWSPRRVSPSRSVVPAISPELPSVFLAVVPVLLVRIRTDRAAEPVVRGDRNSIRRRPASRREQKIADPQMRVANAPLTIFPAPKRRTSSRVAIVPFLPWRPNVRPDGRRNCPRVRR